MAWPRSATPIVAVAALCMLALTTAACSNKKEPPVDEPRYTPEQVAAAIVQKHIDGAKIADCLVQDVRYLGKGLWQCGTVQYDETNGVLGFLPAASSSAGTVQ